VPVSNLEPSALHSVFLRPSCTGGVLRPSMRAMPRSKQAELTPEVVLKCRPKMVEGWNND